MHLYLKEIGQGVQHIASRVEDLPTLASLLQFTLPCLILLRGFSMHAAALMHGLMYITRPSEQVVLQMPLHIT